MQDVQDVPPIFTNAPPVTKLPASVMSGDKVNICLKNQFCVFSNQIWSKSKSYVFIQILQVHAEDGDKGNPREIRYGLVSEGNPFTSFFNINDTTGMF